MKASLWYLGRRRRRPSCAAWLAIVALLADMLLPTGFAVAMPRASPAAIGFCGGAPPSDHPPSVPAKTHCIYCLMAAIGPAPAPPPQPGAAQFVGIAAVPLSGRTATGRRQPFAAAQPRGPPGRPNLA